MRLKNESENQHKTERPKEQCSSDWQEKPRKGYKYVLRGWNARVCQEKSVKSEVF
jgi:hypothetical protein